jgi:peroxiredoxin
MMLKSLMVTMLIIMLPLATFAESTAYQNKIYDPGKLKPIDSKIRIKVGDKAPDFTLPSISGKKISLSQFKGKKNVLISFIPAAWTPVCSDQWPGYNIAQSLFAKHETTLLGISIDNIPSLFAWTSEMGGLWFEVLSDFWPHGKVSDTYGILRLDGVSERGLFLIDKQGILRFIHIEDINKRPELGMIIKAMENITP